MPQGYSRKLHINFLGFYPPGKWSNSWVLQSVIQVSSLESMRTMEVPERSFGGFWHGGCPKDTPRKIHINIQISICLGSAPSPMCLQSVIMESKRMLEVPERSLGGFWYAGYHKDTSRKLHINFQVSTPQESHPTPGFPYGRGGQTKRNWLTDGRTYMQLYIYRFAFLSVGKMCLKNAYKTCYP